MGKQGDQVEGCHFSPGEGMKAGTRAEEVTMEIGQLGGRAGNI